MRNDATLTIPRGGYHASGVTLGLSGVGRERTGVKYKVAEVNSEVLLWMPSLPLSPFV